MSVKLTSKIKSFSVLKPSDPAVSPSPAPVKAPEPSDRRLVLAPVEGVVEGSLRFPSRPKSLNGFQAWSSDFIVVNDREKFALSISHYVNGITHPFEVFAMGQEQPASASLLCQMLSKVLSTNEKPFIKHYLSSLKRARGEAFPLTLPYTGKTVTANSLGSAIALVVEAHAKQIGYFLDEEQDAESPMLKAMTSPTEQKSRGQGGLASYDDVFNSSTGDDFPIFIKEAWLESEGRTVPISVWFGTEKAPAESDAILKILSLAMRHRDPKWPSLFLRTLRKHVEFGKEYGFASVGDRKPVYYGSTWAYVADIIINRYVQLGILNENGYPLQQRSLFIVEEPVVFTKQDDTAPKGLPCPSCSSTQTSMAGGCLSCLQCGWSRCS